MHGFSVFNHLEKDPSYLTYCLCDSRLTDRNWNKGNFYLLILLLVDQLYVKFRKTFLSTENILTYSMKAEIRHQFDLTCSCFSDMYTNLNNKTKVCLHNQFVGGGREGGTRNHYPSFCLFASYPVSLCPLPQVPPIIPWSSSITRSQFHSASTGIGKGKNGCSNIWWNLKWNHNVVTYFYIYTNSNNKTEVCLQIIFVYICRWSSTIGASRDANGRVFGCFSLVFFEDRPEVFSVGGFHDYRRPFCSRMGLS